MKRYLLVLCAIAVISAGNLSYAEPPTIEVTRVEQPPVIDGKLDDAVWKQAAKATDFCLVGSHKVPSGLTDAWLVTDGQFLYLAFLCHDAHLGELVSKQTLRDSGVHADDSLEIFVDAGTAGKTYFHFLLSVGNVQADQMMMKGLSKRDWDASWRSAIFVDPKIVAAAGWSAEVAIPLYVFRRKPGPENWRINLCRNKRTPPIEYSSWSPLEAGFHDPEHFGFIEGLKDITPAPIFAPLVLSTSVAPYSVVDGRYSYQVMGEVTNDGGLASTVELVVVDKPAVGRPTQATEKITLGPLETKKFRLRLQIARPGDRQASVILRNPETGEVLQQMSVPGLEALNPMRAYLDRNYYTTEKEVRVWVLLSMDESERRQAGLRLLAFLVDKGGKVVSSRAVPALTEQVAAELPLRDVPPGRYQVRLELQDRSKVNVAVVELPLAKHPPAPAGSNEVKIDQENRCLLLNGKPFFPVGICALGLLNSETLKPYQDAGFNTLIRWWGVGRNNPISAALESLEAARGQGLYMIDTPLAFLHQRLDHRGLLVPEGMTQAVQEMTDFLLAVRNHPAVLAYYGLDEAPGKGPLAEPLQAFLQKVHELDPYHPVYISGGTALGQARYDFADILGGHIYWCSLGAKGGDNPNVMAQAVEGLFQRVTEPRQRPLFIMPQSEITSHSRRPHTPRERRINVYLALIHGAKSIIYFASPIRHRLTFENMKELSAELHVLMPTLLTRRPPQEITVDPVPPTDELPIVQALLKDRPQGGTLLLAGNSSPYPVQVKWDLSAMGTGIRVSDFLGQKKFRANKGIFADNLESYATRAYLIEGASRKPGSRAVIGLALSGEAVERMKEQMKPVPELKRLNLVMNPDFEEEGKGWTVSKQGMSYPAEGRNGTRCLKVIKTDAKTIVRITADPITLKPNTRYRYGGWVRTKLTQGESGGSFYINELAAQAKIRVRSGLPFPPTHAEWKMFSRAIATPGLPPVKATFWYYVPAGRAGEIWLDDLFVEELPLTPTEVKPKNMLINSSFEEAALPGWPDSWFFGATKDGQMIGDPGAPGQDDTFAYHGKYSLKIVNPYDRPSGFANATYRHKFASQGMRGGIPVEIGKTYVFSVYLRAEQEGAKADLVLCNFAWNSPLVNEGVRKTVILTTEWKRYQVACTIPTEGWTRGVRPEVAVLIYHKGVDSAIWADAAQLEEGEQATPYTPDDYRAVPVTENR